MAATLQYQERFRIRIWNGSEIGFAVVGSGAEQMLIVSDACTLAMAGEVIADDLLADRLRVVPGGDAQENLPDQLMAIFSHLGASGLQGLNGSYAIAVWDHAKKCLTVVCDRYGMQPFYYWHSGEELLFASRIQAIASHPRFKRQINPTAVFDLLAAEQMLDERTLYADVQAMPPAGLLTYQDGRLVVQSYWQPALYQSGLPAPQETEAIDGLAGRVMAAVNRRLSGMEDPRDATGICLLLTGGLDSRLLAGALARRTNPIPVQANTIGHDQARDVRFGREIAKATGLPYTMLPANPQYLADYAKECVRRTEGGFNVHAAWILGEIDYLTQNHIPAIMDGVGAEAVSGRHWLSDQPVTTRDEALESLCQARWTFNRAGALLQPKIRRDAMEAARETLRRTLDEAPSDYLLGWADYFAYRQNHRHPTGNILADDARVLEPFFDNALVDYAYSLPPALRANGRLYKKMIVLRFPEVANIGYTDSGIPLIDEIAGQPAPIRLEAKVQNFNRRVYRRLARRFPFLRHEPFGDNPASALYYNHWLRTASRGYVTNVLRREELFADYLDVARVRQLVEDHMRGRQDEFRLISGIVTFALWREMFGP